MLQFLIPAAASIGASLLSKSSSDKNNATSMRIAQENNAAAERNALRQEELQREFAQSGIQWKVDDAKKAGVHPLYALGAQTTAYAPQSVGYQSPSLSSPDWRGISDAGQHIGRAIQSTQSTSAQQTAFLQAVQATQLEGARLDNDIKRAELASRLATTATGRGPGVPTAVPSPFDYFGGVSGDAIKLKGPEFEIKTRRDIADRDTPSFIPGSGPSVGWSTNTTGGYSPTIPPELAESYEADTAGLVDWIIRNRVGPNFSSAYPRPAIPHRSEIEYVDWNHRLQQMEVVLKPEAARRMSFGRGIEPYRRTLRWSD